MSLELFLNAILLTTSALLPIMNPFSTAPLFVSLTSEMPTQRRTQQALMGCLYAFVILVVFLLLGGEIINFFGISVPGIRVAGGLIISTIGLRMLFPQPKAGSTADEPRGDIAFTPIAMPSLAGPGSISVVLSGAAQIKSQFAEERVMVYIAVIIGMALTLAFSFFVLRAASAMVRVLGDRGIDAMTRIFGFLLVCIGMQFLLTGIDDFYGISKG
ncbi:MAG: MarC family NAAT transporter [Rhodospirillales bacterium]|nr:MarC family NAAT transporter [Rhodospirillales bacterium]